MHAALLATIAVGLVAAGLRSGGAGLLLLWPALSFAIVAAAYLRPSPGVFGKTPGRSPLSSASPSVNDKR